MKKFLCFVAVMFVLTGSAFGAGKSEMKRMSKFLSGFTEAGLFNFDIRAEFYDGENEQAGESILHLGIPDNVTELANFGIINNLINNPERIQYCNDPECESGSLKLDKKYVVESVRKYFGIDLAQKDLSPISENPSVVFSYDGRMYHFDSDSFSEPGNDSVYYAEVQDIDDGGRYTAASGYIYEKKRPSRKLGKFSAMLIPSKWQGKNSWLIISMSTKWSR